MTVSSPTWHPFTQMKGAGPFPVIQSADGAMLYPQAGPPLIDGISSWWVITHGHCEPEIVAAIQKQVATLDQVVFAGFTHPMAEALSHELIQVTPPSLSRVFYSDDGSTAVEVALKMAFQSCRQRGMQGRNTFLGFSLAYHGDTVGAMSAGGVTVFTREFQELTFEVVHADQPTHSQEPVEAWLQDFLVKIDQYADRLAGVIVEPLVQGSAGMVMWPEEAIQAIAAACKERGIYLIFDEVMTGFGRTGSMFVMDKLGVEPDLVCLSKGLTGGMLPMSATLASETIYQSFYSDDRAKAFFHGHSFTANPVTCAAAVTNLRLMRERDMPATWARIEAVHRERLARLAGHDRIHDARVCGTIAAVEMKSVAPGYLAPVGPKMHQHALASGVLLRPLGNVLYILPPYCITNEQLHRCWDVLGECLEM